MEAIAWSEAIAASSKVGCSDDEQHANGDHRDAGGSCNAIAGDSAAALASIPDDCDVGYLAGQLQFTGAMPHESAARILPLPYGGDYLVPSMQLRPGLGDPGAGGFAFHLKSAAATE